MSDLTEALVTQALWYEQIVANQRRLLLTETATLLSTLAQAKHATPSTTTTGWSELTQETVLDVATVTALLSSPFDT